MKPAAITVMDINDDCLYNILVHAGATQTCVCCRVCSRWYILIHTRQVPMVVLAQPPPMWKFIARSATIFYVELTSWFAVTSAGVSATFTLHQGKNASYVRLGGLNMLGNTADATAAAEYLRGIYPNVAELETIARDIESYVGSRT